MIAYKPWFASILHIRPWEMGLLTARDFDASVQWLHDTERVRTGD